MKKGDPVTWIRNYPGGGENVEATFLEHRGTKIKILLHTGVIKYVTPDWIEPKKKEEKRGTA